MGIPAGERVKMSFKVKKLKVGKGKTIGNEKAAEWIKRYYEMEIEIEDEHDIEIAKTSVEGLIDGWLTPSELPSQHQGPEIWNPSQIHWQQAISQKGPYEKSEDYNSLHHKALVRDLAQHKNFLIKGDYKYWLFDNGSTIGRKRKGKQ